MTTTVEICVERGDDEICVECEFEVHAACRGARDSLCGVRGAGPALEPDEPAYAEFVKATVDGKPFELTDDEKTRAEEAAMEVEPSFPEGDE